MLMAGIALSAQGWAINHGLQWQTFVFDVLCMCQMGHMLAGIRSENQSLFRAENFQTNQLLAQR
jgi:Ca2+-transporting ATPase